jgi:membrane fusion protein, adhesin transport system
LAVPFRESFGLVADIVPVSEQMVIEARLPVQEVGYVSQGQDVTIRLASAASSQFSSIMGSVVGISPDAIEDQNRETYYRVRVATQQTAFQDAGVIYKLIPGVQVTCHIITGERSVLAYILGPILSGAQKAFQER